jgi:hypothetical protein
MSLIQLSSGQQVVRLTQANAAQDVQRKFNKEDEPPKSQVVLWQGRTAFQLLTNSKSEKVDLELATALTQRPLKKTPLLKFEPERNLYPSASIDWKKFFPALCRPGRELKAHFSVRINLSTLFEKAQLDCMPKKLSENLHRELFLKAKDVDPQAGQLVWMKLLPERDGYHVEFTDPHTNDLAECSHTFCRIEVFPGKEAILEEFTSPSFSSTKAMSLVWNFMKMARIENMLFSDISTIPGCCEHGALTSLHLVQIFIYQQSWFAKHNAKSEGKLDKFQYLFEEDEVDELDNVLQGKSLDGRASPTLDYDLFRSKFLPRFLENWASNSSYEAASCFLHTLTVNDLINSISPLIRRYPGLNELKNLCSTMCTILSIPQSITVGKFLKITIEKGMHNKATIMHEFMHECRDTIVSNKNSEFFQYMLDELDKTPREVSPRTLAFAFLIIDNFSDIIKRLLNPSLDPTTIIHELFKMSEEEANDLVNTKAQDFLHQRAQDNFLDMLEKSVGHSYVSAKIVANSTRHSREKWVEYSEETGFNEPYSAVYSAIRYLSSLTIKDLKQIYPEFIQPWLDRYSILAMPQQQNMTIANIVILVADPKVQRKFLDELVRGAMKHLSTFTEKLLDNHLEDPKAEDVYELFMLSKYICKKGDPFVLQLQE